MSLPPQNKRNTWAQTGMPVARGEIPTACTSEEKLRRGGLRKTAEALRQTPSKLLHQLLPWGFRHLPPNIHHQVHSPLPHNFRSRPTQCPDPSATPIPYHCRPHPAGSGYPQSQPIPFLSFLEEENHEPAPNLHALLVYPGKLPPALQALALCQNSHSQACPALAPTGSQDPPPSLGPHPQPKTVGLLSPTVIWLKCPFHDTPHAGHLAASVASLHGLPRTVNSCGKLIDPAC